MNPSTDHKVYVATLGVGPCCVFVVEAVPLEPENWWRIELSGFFSGQVGDLHVNMESHPDTVAMNALRVALEAAYRAGHTGSVTLVHQGAADPELVSSVVGMVTALALDEMNVAGMTAQ